MLLGTASICQGGGCAVRAADDFAQHADWGLLQKRGLVERRRSSEKLKRLHTFLHRCKTDIQTTLALCCGLALAIDTAARNNSLRSGIYSRKYNMYTCTCREYARTTAVVVFLLVLMLIAIAEMYISGRLDYIPGM